MCFDLAVKAFQRGSLPISCIVWDAMDKPISKAQALMVYGSHQSNMTQHAEMKALSQISLSQLTQKLTLYTTVEPCPMCFGAMNVARISELHYGTRDPWAGSTDLLNGNWYMKRKQINIQTAPAAFERVMAIFVNYAMVKKPGKRGFWPLNNEFLARWGLLVPDLRRIIIDLMKSDFGLFRNAEMIFDFLGKL